MATIISIANNKGGVGKTTSTVNIGYALSLMGKKVLLLDFDNQGSLSIYFGIEPNQIASSIADVLNGKCSMFDCIIPLSDNLHLCPSTIDLDIEKKENCEFALKNILEGYCKNYDYILIDNSPSFGTLTLNSLVASDYVIAPVASEYLSFRGLEILHDSISHVQKINPKLELMGAMITMFDGRISHHNEAIELIKGKYKTFNPIIKRSVKFADAGLSFQSVIQHAGNNFDGSIAYTKIAEEVEKIVNEKNTNGRER